MLVAFEHPRLGLLSLVQNPIKFFANPVVYQGGALMFSENKVDILSGFLGKGNEEGAALAAAGIIDDWAWSPVEKHFRVEAG